MVQQIPFEVLRAAVGSSSYSDYVDISNYINSVSYSNQGSGRIRVGTIMLDAKNGQFITNANSGVTPKIQRFDKFQVIFEDKNAVIKMGILEVDQLLDQKDTKTGVLLPLELKGRERGLQDVKTYAYYQFKDPKFVINDLLNIFAKNQGNLQAEVVAFNFDTSLPTNNAPDTVSNDYDFSAGVTIYDAIMEVVRRLNQATELGGVGDFYSVTFNDNVAQQNVVTINIFVQGTVNGVIPIFDWPVIQSLDTDPIHNITKQENTEEGTQVFVRGMPNTSYLPPDLHRFSSYVETINNYPPWSNTSIYTNGIRISFGGTIYQAIGNVPVNTSPPNGLYWQPMTAIELINSLIAANYNAWDSSISYPEGTNVSYFPSFGLNTPYVSILPVPAGILPTNATYWQQLSINYSLWTKQKDTVTKNSCSNPDHDFVTGGLDAPAFPDGNLVIMDRVNSETGEYIFYRDFVICRAIDPANIVSDSRLKNYLMGPSKNTFYKGFTVLVDTTLGSTSGVFAANGGKDINGRFFADSFVQYDGANWIVTRTPVSSNPSDSQQLQIGDQCCVQSEGRTYEYNKEIVDTTQLVFGAIHSTSVYPYKYLGPNFGLTKWQDVSSLQGGNDAFHHPTNIEAVDGFYPKLVGPLDYSSYVSESALKITYEFDLGNTIYQAGKTLLDKIVAFGTQVIQDLKSGQINDIYTWTSDEIALTQLVDLSNYGWWYALPMPYPLSTFNGIEESVGEFYGGDETTASEFGALDLINSNYSHSGKQGLNHDEVSDMGGPLTGIQILFQFDILYGGAAQNFQGNQPFTMTIYDDFRNVWRADFSIRFLSAPQAVPIPFSSFTVDRPSRVPINMDSITKNLVDLISPAELLIQNIFEQRRVRLITIQYGGSYDEFLRFTPINIDKMVRTGAGAIPISFIGTIDAIGFTKAPFVSSGVQTDRVINPDIIDAPNIRNYVQLQAVANAEKDLYSLPFEQYTVIRDLSCDLELEQSVYLSDIDMIDEEDKVDTPNTRKLILMVDTLSYDQVQGDLRTMVLTKRLNGP